MIQSVESGHSHCGPAVIRPLAVALALFICGAATLKGQSDQSDCSQGTSNSCSDSGAPNMAAVSDVLSGKRTLLRDDDFMYGTISTSVGQGYILKTENSTIIRPTAAPPSPNAAAAQGGDLYKPSPFYGIATAVGRMQAIGTDTAITLQPTASGWQVEAANYGTPGYDKFYLPPSSYQPYGTNYTQVVMGDFDGSYTKQAVLYYSSSSSLATVVMRIARSPKGTTADDPQLQFGPEYVQQVSGNAPVVNVGTLTVGDFNGDGYDEIAALLTDNHTLVVFSVDTTTYEIKPYATVPLTWNNNDIVMSPVALAAGRYRNNFELVAVGQSPTDFRTYTVVPIGVTISTDSKGNQSASFAAQAPQEIANQPSIAIARIQAQAAAVTNWASATQEQLVVASTSAGPLLQIAILSFDSDWTVSLDSLTNDSQHCSYGLAVGNFDHHNSDSTRDQNLQIAILANDTDSCSVNSVEQQQRIRIYDVAIPENKTQQYTLKVTSEYKFDGVHDNVAATIAFGDLQGRSVTVGPPDIVTITDRREPDIILGMPPMHADWIKPQETSKQDGCTDSNGKVTYCLFNFTFYPTAEPSYGKGFFTGFEFSADSSKQSQRTATTSWGIAVKQTAEAQVTWGDPGIDSTSIDIKNVAAYTHDNTVSKTYNTYNKMLRSITVLTGSSDYIFYTEKTHNVYYYPILGAAGCPDGNPNCNESERRYIAFSVPDNVHRQDLEATLKEWYNPVQEPGNIFSYPWSLNQLTRQFSERVKVLAQPTGCKAAGQTSTDSLKASWTSSTSQEQSTASSNQFSDELSTTISSTFGDKDLGVGGSFTYNLDITGSTSLKTLNVDKQVLDSSTGIQTNMPGFPDQTYQYGWVNYILGVGNGVTPYQTFGQTTPSQPFGTLTDLQGNPVPDQKTGTLVVGYLASPLGNSTPDVNCEGDTALSWKLTYNKPDVALNHPQRLKFSKVGPSLNFNSLDPAKSDPREQPFYRMKGFFVYTPPTAGGLGPMLESAPASHNPRAPYDVPVSLAVRVYNYSLVPIDPSYTVHVRFYGQVVCNTDSCTDPKTQPATSCTANSLCGPSFLIDEVSLTGGIPAYGGDQLNWVLASTAKLDTSDLANTDLAFWVLTWIEDSNGNMVGEMPDHGLSLNPAKSSYASITQTPIQAHSNNVGLYGFASPFHVGPPLSAPPSAADATASSGAGPRTPPSGPVTSVKVTQPGQLLLGEETVLRSTLQAGDQPVGPVTINYFDGNPQRGGRLIDSQKVAHIDPNAKYHAHTFYTPQSCGVRSLYTIAEVRGQASVHNAVPMTVTIEPESALDALVKATIKAGFRPSAETELVKLLRHAQDAFDWQEPNIAHVYLKTYTLLLKLAARGMNRSVIDALTSQVSTVIDCTSSNLPLVHSRGWGKGAHSKMTAAAEYLQNNRR